MTTKKRTQKKTSKPKKSSHTLVFNVGSSSIKYAVFAGKHKVLSENIERVTTSAKRKKIITSVANSLFRRGLVPSKIGHRIVHGGMYTKPVKITSSVLHDLYKVAELAPLHDLPELEVIEFCDDAFGVSQYAVFDTAFHQTIPTKAHMYAIPKKYYLKGVRKYGFHGISHEYVSSGFKGNVISCHLGSGASICAIKNGKSVDTSMGFTPLDGLVMGTRSGSIDAGVIPYLARTEHMLVSEIKTMLNTQSGLKAIGGSADVRDLLSRKTKNAKLALDMYVYRIVCTIGSYAAALGGVDSIIFTAGTGERSSQIRKRVCDGLAYLGVKLDGNMNRRRSEKKRKISARGSKVKIYVVPTDEERAIADKIISYKK